MFRGARFFIAPAVLCASAGALPLNCARVLARAGSAWTLLRLPARLDVVHQYRREGELVLVHPPTRVREALHLIAWPLVTDRSQIGGTLTVLPWEGEKEDPEHFRPQTVSPDGRTVATTLRTRGMRVALHRPDELPGEARSLLFQLSNEDRAPVEGIAPYTALNLSFSADGAHLLAQNPLGWEAYAVATRERVLGAFAPSTCRSQFAGWLCDGSVVEMRENGDVFVHPLGELPTSVGSLPRSATTELLDASTVAVGGRTALVFHSSFRPLVFEVRHPLSLEPLTEVRVTGLPDDAELEWIALVPEGLAVFRVSTGITHLLGAVNLHAALRAGQTELRW